jgi:two-component system phosphate regulon sensor histidine kinase PhoR
MFTGNKKSRPLFWFYILVGYVFIQFIWWGYMMFYLNNESVLLKTEINLLKGESLQEVMIKGNELNEKLHKRWMMIAGEGLVFMGLLITGIYQIRKTFRKEEALSQQQNNFLLSVTHELKSPIASAKLQLQTLKKHELPRDKQLGIIENAINDTDRLNTLVENILLASKIENKVLQLDKEQKNISQYIYDTIINLQQAFHYKRDIQFKITPDIYMPIDTISFASIVINLFENAVKYSPENSTIIISLEIQNEKIIFEVADEGVGIKQNEKQNVFKKFYRVGSEETRSTKGTGLGLYIVENLVRQHNGTITVKNNVPKGSIFAAVFSV